MPSRERTTRWSPRPRQSPRSSARQAAAGHRRRADAGRSCRPHARRSRLLLPSCRRDPSSRPRSRVMFRAMSSRRCQPKVRSWRQPARSRRLLPKLYHSRRKRRRHLPSRKRTCRRPSSMCRLPSRRRICRRPSCMRCPPSRRRICRRPSCMRRPPSRQRICRRPHCMCCPRSRRHRFRIRKRHRLERRRLARHLTLLRRSRRLLPNRRLRCPPRRSRSLPRRFQPTRWTTAAPPRWARLRLFRPTCPPLRDRRGRRLSLGDSGPPGSASRSKALPILASIRPPTCPWRGAPSRGCRSTRSTRSPIYPTKRRRPSPRWRGSRRSGRTRRCPASVRSSSSAARG